MWEKKPRKETKKRKVGVSDEKTVRIMIMVCVLTMCVGCSFGSSTEKKLVGTWYDDENDAIELVFYEDGSYRHGNSAVQVNGDYKLVSENEIELTSNASGLGADMWHVAGIHEFSLDGDTLTIKSGGGAGTYHKGK
ncbi:hypothetical protein NXH76_17725 [Blautia schinkii]|nr:hypothetical protein [Blautia schinkii]